MADPIRVIIRGSDAAGSDAPTVDDLLGQVRDFVDVLRGVEKALEHDGNLIVWRVTNVTKNSPIAFELTPTTADAAAFVGARAERIERAVSGGLKAFQSGNDRPPYFTDEVLPKARKMYERVTNGLADTVIQFDRTISEPLTISVQTAGVVQKQIAAREAEAPVPYRELGSLEGYFARAELDGNGRPVLWFRTRLDGAVVKAIAVGDAFRQMESLRLGDLWGGARIRVYGTISYKDLGVIDGMRASGIEVLDADNLPGLDDIVDPNFTGGLSSEEFLAEVRNG